MNFDARTAAAVLREQTRISMELSRQVAGDALREAGLPEQLIRLVLQRQEVVMTSLLPEMERIFARLENGELTFEEAVETLFVHGMRRAQQEAASMAKIVSEVALYGRPTFTVVPDDESN
jgi:hypothetical protein